MRDILFRGKRIDNNEWSEGFIVICDDRYFILPKTKINCLNPEWLKKGEYAFCCFIEVDPETVGQFTGLTDKNGKRIFEGDIVVCKQEICGNWIDCCMEFGFVEMKHGAFGLHRKQGYYRPFKDWLEDYEYEVLGNIHDNPELLKNP